jgi:hypothetical protein
VQQTDSTPTKTVDRPIHAPTAIGPVSTTPEAGLRAGRERSSTNYATLRGDILPIGPSDTAAAETAASPNLGPAGDVTLPHAQTSEITDTASRERQRLELQQQPEVASRTAPGAVNELPPR